MPLTIHTAPHVLTMDTGAAGGPVLAGGAVLVDGDRIAAVGLLDDLVAAHPAARVRSWPGVLTPGLVNAHAHLQFTDFAHLAHTGLPFPDWLRAIVAAKADYTDARWQESARRGVHYMLRSGTTCVADVVTDACVVAPTARSGIGGISYLEVIGDTKKWADGWRAALLGALDDGAAAGRTVGVSAHTPYTVGTAVFKDTVAIARSRGLRMHPHLAESEPEVEFTVSGTGRLANLGFDHELAGVGSGLTPAAYLESLDALGRDVHVAHGVHLDAADRERLRARGTAVALCVRSNRILGAGEPPIAAYLAEGSPIALGTDSLASSPSLDLWEEAAAARELAVRQGYDAGDLDRRLVEAATVGGATAMGLADVGVLREGGRADLAVFDVTVDGGDVWGALVNRGGGSCAATVLAGRIVHRA